MTPTAIATHTQPVNASTATPPRKRGRPRKVVAGPVWENVPAREAGAVFDCPAAVREYLLLQLFNEPRELFGVLWLDSQHRAICFEVSSVGTTTQTSVYPRELARAALKHNAAAAVLCHNHPSGSLTPSAADQSLTRVVKTTLALVDVRVLDHIIVGGVQTASMAELGMM